MRLDITKLLHEILGLHPDQFGFKLNQFGWLGIPEIVRVCQREGVDIAAKDILKAAYTNRHHSFTVSPDNQFIRLSRGETLLLNLATVTLKPPALLYRAVRRTDIGSIMQAGLSNERENFELYSDRNEARRLGEPHSLKTIIKINAETMLKDKIDIFYYNNGSWIFTLVPPCYITV